MLVLYKSTAVTWSDCCFVVTVFYVAVRAEKIKERKEPRIFSACMSGRQKTGTESCE